MDVPVCGRVVEMVNRLKYYWSKTNRWHRVLFIFLIVELKLLPGGQVGFQCNDPALSYPYTGDTINWKWLMGVTLFLPLFVMLIVERQQDKANAKQKALNWYKEYLYGFMINLTLIQGLKLIVGSPRPHFFDTCRPKEALTCQASEYVSSYTCTKAHWLNQSDKSFPSGHTSLAVHAGIFIAYYLQQRGHQINSKSIQVVQVISILATLYCSVSRMYDHRHHWWDVLAGFFLALPILMYTINSLCKNFECLCVTPPDIDNKKENATDQSNIEST